MEFAGENQKGETFLEGKREEKSLEGRRLEISRESSLSLQLIHLRKLLEA